jgi:hypothetical protein
MLAKDVICNGSRLHLSVEFKGNSKVPFVLPNCLWYPETAHSLHTQQVGILILLQQKRISYQVVLNDSTSLIPCALSQLVNDPCCGLQIAFAVLEFLWRSWERLVLVLEIGKFSGRHVH